MSIKFENVIQSEKPDALDPIGFDLNRPRGLVVDSEGSLIFVDSGNHRIMKIFENGKVVLLAGSGNQGFRDGVGAKSQFNEPCGITVDRQDNFYVCDFANQAIRKVSKGGYVTTILSGTIVGKCVDLTYYENDDVLFFNDGYLITRVKPDGSGVQAWAGSREATGRKDAQGTSASFYFSFGVSVNQKTGDIYVADYGNNAIRKVNATAYVSTVVQDAYTVWGIGVAGNEYVYYVEHFNRYLKRINLSNGDVEHIAGNGFAGLFDGLGVDGLFSAPCYLTYSPKTNLVYVGEYSGGIRVINKFNYVSTLITPAGSGYIDGPAWKSRFSGYIDLTLDDMEEYLYVCDKYNNAIRKVSLSDGSVVTIAGKQEPGNSGGDLLKALFNGPSGLTNLKGILLIADMENNLIKSINITEGKIYSSHEMDLPIFVQSDREQNYYYAKTDALSTSIEKFTKDGIKVLSLLGGVGCQDGSYSSATAKRITDVAFDDAGNMFISDFQCNTIRIYNSTTGMVKVLAGTTDKMGFKDGLGSKAMFSGLFGIDYSTKERALYVCDSSNNLIRRVSENGNVTTYAGIAFKQGHRDGPKDSALLRKPQSMIISSDGTIYFTDSANSNIRVIRPNGIVGTLSGYGSVKYRSLNPNEQVNLQFPSQLATCGNVVYVANREESNILELNVGKRQISVIAGNGGFGWIDGKSIGAMFNRPEGVACNGDELFVADTVNHLIRKVKIEDGTVSTYAGTGMPGLKNGNLLESEFDNPTALVFDSNGSLFVTDTDNHVIRKIAEDKVSLFSGGAGIIDFVDGRHFVARYYFPQGIAFDPIRNVLLVTDTFNHAIRVLNSTHVSTISGNGTYGLRDGDYKSSLFSYPKGVTTDSSGGIYISDWGNDRIRVLNGTKVITLENLIKAPVGITFADGSILVGSTLDNSISKFALPTVAAIDSMTPNNNLMNILIAGIVASVIVIVSAAVWIRTGRRKTVKQLKNMIEKPVKIVEERTIGTTVTLGQDTAFAIPGYLEINIKKSIRFENDSNFAGQGGTAVVLTGKLKDAKLIEKHGFLEVAVKYVSLSQDSSADSDGRNTYFEIAIMNSIPKSKYIVELVGFSHNPLAIVMKYYPLSLIQLLIEQARNDEDHVLLARSLSQDIIQGMNLVHEKGIIHYDLKPGNVLIDINCEGRAFTAVICDFGFANFSAEASKSIVKGLKRPSVTGITARYAAPELFQVQKPNSSDIDASELKKVDVYAYAMTCYFMFAREKPWDKRNIFEIEQLVVTGNRPDIHPAIPEDISHVIKNCWAQDPRERPNFRDLIIS